MHSIADHEEARRLLKETLAAYRLLDRMTVSCTRQDYIRQLKHARLLAASLKFQLDRVDAPARYALGGIPHHKTPYPHNKGGAGGSIRG
ncbi:hypothetical protein E4U03_07845 [Rothia nasimurium]|uniref:Uncharacterized protein n=1 Tax=Rothia nasimurium TaxID=85336 RepID=A0A4Y9F2N7_9MICC|nr:hypothetical protein [Rothia nasimurium]MBF0808520.1 hypothetical protein [Rothia nasimurium]TFU21914.1 hypothetical protein E4U03_07845 [Rothia nasimurium]